MERPLADADRHRRGRPRGPRRARAPDPGSGAGGARRRRRGGAGRRRQGRAAARRSRGRRAAAALASAGARRRQQGRHGRATCRSRRSSTRLGLGEPIAVSAAQGLGTGDLLDRIVELGPPAEDEGDEDEADAVRLAVIGRPNVGKSSLVNRFAGAERRDRLAGGGDDTRRDRPADRVRGPRLILVDTAGLRRQAKVGESVEYYTSLRSRRAAERADVALVVCDATDGITGQDLRSPSWRCERVRDRAGAQQVGHRRRASTSSTSAPVPIRSSACVRGC